MRKSEAKITFSDLPRSYPALVAMLPPRPLHDRVDYENTMEVVMAMAGHKLTRDQEDYLAALSGMVLEYDRVHEGPPKRGTEVKRLRYLAEQAGLTASDLGRLLGNRGLGSLLLTGKRSLSKAHIRKLAEHFKMHADYFL